MTNPPLERVAPDAAEPSTQSDPRTLSSEAVAVDESPDPYFHAMKWAEIYRDDPDFRDWWEWFDKTKDDKKADQKERLQEQILKEWEPDEIPPPIRKWVIANMKSAK